MSTGTGRMAAQAGERDGAAPWGAQVPLAVAETALLVVHLSVVGGFARLYEDGSFVGGLSGFTVGAHVLAVTLRRRRLPTALVVAVAVLGAVLAATWILFPASTRYALPTRETWDLAGDALRVSRDRFEQVAAPAPVIPGFQLAAGLALYGAVWFADWAAFRLRATVEAVAPATVLFVFGAMLGSGRHRFTATLTFAGAVLLFVACHRALRAQLDHAWLTAAPLAGPRAVLRAGAGLAVVGLVAGAVVGPRLPGSEAEAMVRWRSDTSEGGDRSTVSPIVDLRKRLVNQSEVALFTVRADRRAYWRLTALDVFDGQLWSSSGRFSPAGGRLPSTTPQVDDGRRNRQEFEIRALATIWAPTAYKARSLDDTSGDLRWDVDSSTLITADATSDGLSYDVLSETPVIDPVVLAEEGSPIDDGRIGDRYLDLPGDFPEVASRLAGDVTRGADSRYARALALQDHFREGYAYSLDVDPGNGDEALVDFLSSRQGYCEQFAGAYAAMARSVGLPARVAVGFTPGDPDPNDPDLYTVRGKHAHAWPEVWFPEVGWVPFEPTPGRGNPDAEDYTGVPEDQDETATDPAAGTATTTSTTVVGGATSAPGSTAPPATATPSTDVVTGTDPEAGGGPSGITQAAVAVVALAALWLAVVLAAPAVRRRRRRRAARSASAVLDAWHDALAPVRWLTELRPRAAETHDEFSRRAGARLGRSKNDLRELGALATRASWDPAGATVADVEAADALATALHHEAARHEGSLARWRRRLSWREAFDQPRRVAGAR